MLNNYKLQELIAFANSHGLVISKDKDFIPNKLYRCPTLKHKNSKNGWYVLKYDGYSNFACFVCGNYETSGESYKLTIHISEQNNNPLSKNSYAKTRAKVLEIQKQHQADIVADKIKKANFYRNKFNQLKLCFYHPYMESKGFEKINRYGFKYQMKYKDNLLCVPFLRGGIIQGYQTLNQDGQKRFNASVKGCYWHYMPKPNYHEYRNIFVVGEGIATVLSAFEALEDYYGDAICFQPLVSFGCNNLEATIKATSHFEFSYILLVDNDLDKPLNAGVEAANNILRNNPNLDIAPLLMPMPGDANDYILEKGRAEFIKYFKECVNLGEKE